MSNLFPNKKSATDSSLALWFYSANRSAFRRTGALWLLVALVSLGLGHSIKVLASDSMKLPAQSMLWLSDANEAERERSFDPANRFKLKSIQELAVMRFDTSAIKGHLVHSARLYMKPARPVKVRYLRVSTVTQRWAGRQELSAADVKRASTWKFADPLARTSWAWPGSVFADVIMSSGNSIATWDEVNTTAERWLYVDIPSDIIYALAAGISDGLAVVDGGSIALNNNYFKGRGTADAPYLQLELGKPFSAPPPPPVVHIEQTPESETVTLQIRQPQDTFGWQVSVTGQPLPQWQIPRPHDSEVAHISLGKLTPAKRHTIAVQAVSRAGELSAESIVSIAPTSLPTGFKLPAEPPRQVIFEAPDAARARPQISAWAPHVKISPLTGMPVAADRQNAQSMFSGNKVSLFGARGEYVSFQLMLERSNSSAPDRFRVDSAGLKGPGQYRIGQSEIELFKQWYSRTRAGVWQPAYAVPMQHKALVTIPDPRRALAAQQTQGIWVDVYIPKDAPRGLYAGAIAVHHDNGPPHTIPIQLEVYDFVLPDKLSYWAELNTYSVPRRHLHEYFRLAHQHRAVFMPWVLAPEVTGAGAQLKLDFRRYDRLVGPLLSGAAFASNRRERQPVRALYLPFMDSWPTPLTRADYDYPGHWPGKGDSHSHIVAHYEHAPYIGDALSTDYKTAIHTAQQQFVEHFARRGWNKTEMHAFYGGKNTHRIKYGSNMWWTTDEPYHWDDWLAVQFFTQHWRRGPAIQSVRAQAQWRARTDISRPQWLGRVLEGGTNTIYFAGSNFTDPTRLRQLQRHNRFELRAYGGFPRVGASTTSTITHMLWLWLNGANAFLPWQTLGNDRSLDLHDNVGGAAILVPGARLGHHVLADLRLRAARDAQQLIEYLRVLSRRRGLSRDTLRSLVAPFLFTGTVSRSKTADADNADALRSTPWKLTELMRFKRAIAELLQRCHESGNCRDTD